MHVNQPITKNNNNNTFILWQVYTHTTIPGPQGPTQPFTLQQDSSLFLT